MCYGQGRINFGQEQSALRSCAPGILPVGSSKQPAVPEWVMDVRSRGTSLLVTGTSDR